ncbi:hypothetical protein PG984_007584 [Apiospora sp. TS-2023a]
MSKQIVFFYIAAAASRDWHPVGTHPDSHDEYIKSINHTLDSMIHKEKSENHMLDSMIQEAESMNRKLDKLLQLKEENHRKRNIAYWWRRS